MKLEPPLHGNITALKVNVAHVLLNSIPNNP